MHFSPDHHEGGGADFHAGVELCRLVDLKGKGQNFLRGKPSRLDAQGIGTDGQKANGVLPRSIRLRGSSHGGCGVFGGDFCTNDNGAARVGHLACDRTSNGLP